VYGAGLDSSTELLRCMLSVITMMMNFIILLFYSNRCVTSSQMMGMFTRRPRTIILTHQDDLTQMLGRHPDLMHESGTGKVLVRAEALIK